MSRTVVSSLLPRSRCVDSSPVAFWDECAAAPMLTCPNRAPIPLSPLTAPAGKFRIMSEDAADTPDLTTDQQQFLAADAALREEVDQLTPEHLKLAVPAEWSSTKVPDLAGILAQHAKDEAWV